MEKLWSDYVKKDQTKSVVLAAVPVYTKYVTCLLQQSLRINSAALCCVACAVREDLHMGKWNKLLLNIIADFGKNFYKKCVKLLRLKSKQYVSIEQLVSSFFIGDWKYTIKLEEALRGKLDMENQCIKDEFDCAINALLKTGDCYIISADEHNWAIWIGDKPHRPSISNITYMFDPHRYHKEDPSDPFAKPKISPCVSRFIHQQYLLTDIFECLRTVGERQKNYIVSKFTLECKQIITRNPSEKFEVYMNKHCPNALGTFEKFFGVKRRKDLTPGLVLPEDSEQKSITDSVLERGSGFFLNPQNKYSCCPEKQFCKKVCTICKTDFKKQIFLENGILDCKEVKIDKKELDHNHYIRHQSGKECWVLEGNHGLTSYRECIGNQGVTVALVALKKIDKKKARAWDKRDMDDIVRIGTVMFKEFCRQSCQFQRPTLLGLSRCLGTSDAWGGWHAKTVAWGGRPGLPVLVAGLLSNNGRGLLQLPGSLDVAIWRDREYLYLFMPDDKNNEEAPCACMYFHTIQDMSAFLADIIPTTADICVSRIDFVKIEENADVDGDKPETYKCICILKADIVEYRYGLPASVALLSIITATEKSSEKWMKKDIEEIIDKAMSFLDNTIKDKRKNEAEHITLRDFPKLFLLEDFGVVETEIFYNVIKGTLQYATEESNTVSLKLGLINFFKEYKHGVLCCRGITIPIWKTPEGNYFYMKYLEKKTEEGDGLDFCMLRVNCEELLAQYIESDLPVSRDDKYWISAVHVGITKVDPNSGTAKLQLKGGYNWLVENQIAILRSWECPKLISECTLPAVMLFGCASSLLPPSKFTAHHLSSFIECSYDVGKRLKKQYRILNAQILDSLRTEHVTFGMHSFQLQFGPKVVYYFDRSNRVDYSILPVARNITPTKYDANALHHYFEKAFNVQDCQQLIIRVNDFLVLSIWKLWADGPTVLFHPQSYFPVPPILDIWRLDETIENKVQPPGKEKKGKKKAKPKKGKKGKKVKETEKEGPRPAVSMFLYPTLKLLAKHIGTILPFGFTEGRIVTYPVKTKIISEVISTTVNPETVSVKASISKHPVPKIGKHFSMLTTDMWYILGNNTFQNNLQGVEKRDKEFSTSVMATVVDSIESVTHWNSELLDIIVKYGHQLYATKIPGGCGKRRPFTVPNNFFVSDFKVNISITHNFIVGDMAASDESGEVYNLVSGLNYFFGNEDKSYGILMARNYTVAVWKMNFMDYKRYKKSMEEYEYFMSEFHAQHPFEKESRTSISNSGARPVEDYSQKIMYPDDFEGSNDIVEVVKTGEVKLPKGKPDKSKGKKGKKGEEIKKKEEVEPEPPLALLPEPPSGGGDQIASDSFRTVNSKEESVHETEATPPPIDVDVHTEVEKHSENIEAEEEEPEEVEESKEGGEGDGEAELPIIEELAESKQDLGGSEEEESEEGSIISPVLSYTTEEEISDSGSSVTAPSISETFFPEDCVVFIWDPSGHCAPKVHGEYGKPAVVSFHSTKDVASFFLENALQTGLGSSRFTLHMIQIEWRHKTFEERAASPKCPPKPRGCRDCRLGEEAATAYVHPGGGRTYLISSEKRTKRMATRNTICWCVAALVMHHLLDINLWSNLTLDDIDAISTELRVATEKKIANSDCQEKDRIIQPEDVIKDFMLSKRQVHVDIEEIFNIPVEGNDQYAERFKFALELFFKGKDPLGYLYTEDRPCCAMWKSQEPNKYFIGINWPKNHVIMYETIDNFITGYLTTMREAKQCILNIKLYKIFVSSKNII